MPALVTDAMLKYQVPVDNPWMTAVVTAAPATSTTWVSELAESP